MIHLVLTGIITLLISLFMAAGAIGENYTDNYFVDPEFLLLMAVWFIGAVLSFVKKVAKLGLIISALPPLLFLGTILMVVLGFY